MNSPAALSQHRCCRAPLVVMNTQQWFYRCSFICWDQCVFIIVIASFRPVLWDCGEIRQVLSIRDTVHSPRSCKSVNSLKLLVPFIRLPLTFHLRPLQEGFLGVHGLRHRNSAVRSRLSYLLVRFIKSLKWDLGFVWWLSEVYCIAGIYFEGINVRWL